MTKIFGLCCCLFIPQICHSQVYSDGMQKVGGGGRHVLIPTDAALAAEKARLEVPDGMTSRMIWATPGKVVARHKQDGKITLEISCFKKTDDGKERVTYLVADHPDAPYLAVGEEARCLIVPGPIRDDFDGRRLYYFFDKKEVSEKTLMQFKAKHADAVLD